MRRHLWLLSLLILFAAASGAQELSKEYIYVGNRLLTVDVPALTGNPDLRIDSLTAASSGPAGGTIRVDYTFGNGGGATSGATAVKFYFSTDGTITTGDTASSTAVALGSGFTGASGFVNVQVPSGLTPGTYYLGAFIDQPPVVAEFDETNNFKAVSAGGAPGAVTVTQGSGVAPQVISVNPTSGSNGEQEFTGIFYDPDGEETLKDMYLRIGDTPSAGCYVRYERLTNSFHVLSSVDNLTWIEVPAGSFAQNARCILDSTSDVTVDAPNNRLSVTWALAFRSPFSSATAKNVTLEVTDAVSYSDSSVEGTWTVPVPNLSFSTTAKFLASTGFVNVDAPISVRIISDGPEVDDVNLEFHRTATSAGSPPNPLTSATRVGTCTAAAPAEGSIECLSSVTLTATGSYKIWAVFVGEANANEGSALNVGNITISNPTGSGSPDLGLTPTSVYPRTLPVGGYGFMNFLVLNHNYVSNPVSQSSTVGLYLSSDPLVTTSDSRIATCSVGSFSTWYSEACSYLFFDPNETGLTNDVDYYVKAIADIFNNVSESNESNQASTSGHILHYGGSLSGTAIRPIITSLPAEASLGEAISYSLKAQNVIPSNVAALGPFYGDIYISETGYLDVGWKQQLGSCTSWSENTQVEFYDGDPWETTCSGSVNIPTSVQGSEHFIVVDFRFANQATKSLLPGGHTYRKAIDLVLPPAVESVTPASGSGRNQTFTLTYSDRNGASDINVVHWLLNGSLNGDGACMIAYYPGTNQLYLISDGAGAWESPITLGSGTLSNSKCTINGAGATVTSSGDELELTLPVTFDYYLGANQTHWMMVSDADSQSTGWVQAGTWTIPGTESQAPTAESVSPSSGEGAAQSFEFTVSDGNGTIDIAGARVSINASSNPVGSCDIRYTQALNSIYLLNDAATGWGTAATLGASTILQNSQCKIDVSGSSVSTSGTDLTLTLDVEFLSAYAGSKNLYIEAYDMSGYSTGTQTLGTWEVPGPPTFLEVGGQVVVEAESGEVVLGTMSKDWQSETSVAGYSGSAYLRAMPDTAVTQNTGYIGVSPGIRIPVQFSSTGTYYVWVRAYMGGTSENTIHAGLDGSAVSTADRIQSTTYNAWTWTNSTLDSVRASINVSSAGLHDVNLWMRQDGFRIDKILLTKNSGYTPTGAGPAESLKVGDPTGSLVISAPVDGAVLPNARIPLTWTAQDVLGLTGCEVQIDSGPQIPYATCPNGTATSTVLSYVHGTDADKFLALDFADGTGAIARDRSVSGDDATILGSAAWGSGPFGSALIFDGTDDAVEPPSPNPGIYHNSFSERTVEAWFRADNTSSTQTIYEEGGTGSGLYIGLGSNTLKLAVQAGSNNAQTIAFQDTAGWHHVAGVFDNGAVRLYLDGQLVGSGTTSSTSTGSPSSDPAVGRTETGDASGYSGTGRYFDGMIDEVAVYSRALSASEIAAHYAGNFLADGSHTITVSADNTGSDTWTDSVTVEVQAANGAFVESSGLVVMDATSAKLTAGTSNKWTPSTAVSSYAGGYYVQSNPDTGTSNNTGYTTSSPRASFPVFFTTTGTYYVWVYGSTPATNGKTVHVGLDNTAVSTADRMSMADNSSWAWTKDTLDAVRATVVVSTPGVHTIDVWMREDGFRFNRILLTTSSGYTPAGAGPAESDFND